MKISNFEKERFAIPCFRERGRSEAEKIKEAN
jgi:hypothetical protein